MIYDTVENMKKYARLDAARRFLEENDCAALPCGRYEIGGDCFVNVSEYETGDGELYEMHEKYADLQMLLSGSETLYYADVKEGALAAEYDQSRDIAFYKADGARAFVLRPGNFIALFPGDLHKGGIADGSKQKIKKLVFKLKQTK